MNVKLNTSNNKMLYVEFSFINKIYYFDCNWDSFLTICHSEGCNLTEDFTDVLFMKAVLFDSVAFSMVRLNLSLFMARFLTNIMKPFRMSFQYYKFIHFLLLSRNNLLVIVSFKYKYTKKNANIM